MTYLHYNKNNKIVGYGNIKITNDNLTLVECASNDPRIIEYDKNNEEITYLYTWFNGFYPQHEQKYRRLHSLGKLTDDGKDPYNELINLYNEAEIKRARIQELERKLNANS